MTLWQLNVYTINETVKRDITCNFKRMTRLFEYFKEFNPLSNEAEQAIAEISDIITIKKNQALQPIGHTCKTIYFITKGVARIYYFKDRIDITERFFFENNIIARIESLFTGKPSRKAIQILEDAEIIATKHKRPGQHRNYLKPNIS